MERDILKQTVMTKQKNFNSHAHVERDRDSIPEWESDCNFNSHAHVERDVYIDNLHRLYTNFNSHAHVERDMRFEETAAETNISTHTLTWSVTNELR